jgi:hypothetical protein
MAAGVVAAAVALALIAAVFDPNSFGALSPVGDALRTIGTPLEYVFGPIFRFFGWLLSFIPFPSTEQDVQPQPLPDEPPREEPEEKPWALPIRWIMTGAVIAAIIAGVLLLLALLFSRFRRGKDGDDSGDEVDHEGGLGDDLAELFGLLKRPFRRASRTPSSSHAIRRLYTEMLDRAAADGIVRAPGTTPSQFVPVLGERYGEDLTRRVTDAFVASRYGSVHIPEDRVRQLSEQWRLASQRQW